MTDVGQLGAWRVTADRIWPDGERVVGVWREFPDTLRTETLLSLTPSQAREMARALVACADCHDEATDRGQSKR